MLFCERVRPVVLGDVECGRGVAVSTAAPAAFGVDDSPHDLAGEHDDVRDDEEVTVGFASIESELNEGKGEAHVWSYLEVRRHVMDTALNAIARNQQEEPAASEVAIDSVNELICIECFITHSLLYGVPDACTPVASRMRSSRSSYDQLAKY